MIHSWLSQQLGCLSGPLTGGILSPLSGTWVRDSTLMASTS